jgi:hypothetical protein
MLVTRTIKQVKKVKRVKMVKTVNYGTKKNPDWGEIFLTRSDRPWGPPSLLYDGYRVFPGGKAAGAGWLPLTPF